jgi:hypothetical protein
MTRVDPVTSHYTVPQLPPSEDGPARFSSVLICPFSPQRHRDTEKPNGMATPSLSGFYRSEVFSVSLCLCGEKN